METRVYFILGDLAACVLAGAAGGWLAHAGVPGDMSSFFAMFIGMFLGMVSGMICGFLLAPFFGAMEVMLPATLAGMIGGMVVAMQNAMAGVSPDDATWMGGAAGVACLAVTYFLQARLHGEVALDE
ncbi:MAG: hypothetical protein ISR45_04655 [Rhodospirillales bacterium]|nr:hypothetical protein [Rhodospirillales bacterium]